MDILKIIWIVNMTISFVLMFLSNRIHKRALLAWEDAIAHLEEAKTILFLAEPQKENVEK